MVAVAPAARFPSVQRKPTQPPSASGTRPLANRAVSHRPPPLAHVALRRNHAPQFQLPCPLGSPSVEDDDRAFRGGCRSPPASATPGSRSVRFPPFEFQAHGSLYHPTTPTTPVPHCFGGSPTSAAAQLLEGAVKKGEHFSTSQNIPASCLREGCHAGDPWGQYENERRNSFVGRDLEEYALNNENTTGEPDERVPLDTEAQCVAEPQTPVPSSTRRPMESDDRAETATGTREHMPMSSFTQQQGRSQRSHPASESHAGDGAACLAQIFNFQKWKPMNQESIPKLCETQPLSLYFHADEQLTSAVRALSKVRDSDSDKFQRCTERVHHAQKLLLDTIYLVYNELDSDLKCPRDYRRHLPSEDQAELDDGFSENILFAAEALSRGFRIRGIERFTEQLLDSAKQLCAGFEALRFVFRSRALELHRTVSTKTSRSPTGAPSSSLFLTHTPCPRSLRLPATLPPVAHLAPHMHHGTGDAAVRTSGVGFGRRFHGPFDSLYPVLMDFDRAWVAFEQKICFAYFTVIYNRQYDTPIPETIPDTFPSTFPSPDYDTEMFAVLISESLGHALNANLISWSKVQEYHPSVMFAIPRLAIVAGLIRMPECVNMTDDDRAFWWFRDRTAILRDLQRDLQLLNHRELEALEKALVGYGTQEDDQEDSDLPYMVSKATRMSPAAEPETGRPHLALFRHQSSMPSGGIDGTCGHGDGCAVLGSHKHMDDKSDVLPSRRESSADFLGSKAGKLIPADGTSELDGLRAEESASGLQLRRLFTIICNVADSLQSGPRAREFSRVLEKAFRFHAC